MFYLLYIFIAIIPPVYMYISYLISKKFKVSLSNIDLLLCLIYQIVLIKYYSIMGMSDFIFVFILFMSFIICFTSVLLKQNFICDMFDNKYDKYINRVQLKKESEIDDEISKKINNLYYRKEGNYERNKKL